MKLLFMGSGSFAVPSLRALLASPSHEVVALVTQPDKPAGRGHRLRLPPTKHVAIEHGLDVHQPARVRHPESVELVRELAPECIVVVAYGQIIPKSILDIPPKGIINVHASLLPRYRGAAPIQWAIARGETETGVSTMLMDEGLDTGPVLLQEKTPIDPDETSSVLEPRLAVLGARLLERTLELWADGALVPTPQDDSDATLAPRIKKEDALVDWSLPARTIASQVRAFDPWPVAFTTFAGVPLKIWKARALGGTTSSPHGTVVAVGDGGDSDSDSDSDTISVACGEGTILAIRDVQLSGKARMAAADFARGKRLRLGTRLGA